MRVVSKSSHVTVLVRAVDVIKMYRMQVQVFDREPWLVGWLDFPPINTGAPQMLLCRVHNKDPFSTCTGLGAYPGGRGAPEQSSRRAP